MDLHLVPGRIYLIEVAERDNDALVEALDANGGVIASADHPERRTGTRRVMLTAPGSGALTVRVTGKEHDYTSGTATVRAFDIAAVGTRADCAATLRTLAAADGEYAAGQQISTGRSASPTRSARETYLRAAEGYAAAERQLAGAGDALLRGETQLALAGLQYQDLQDWASAADWARAAAETLATRDPYREARARALEAAAWIEIGSAAPAAGAAGHGASPDRPLGRARRELERLSRFHLGRGERYDAGLQLTNIGLTYLSEGRFEDCVATFITSARLFASIHEKGKRAQAWENRALCLWGLGRLAEARSWLERALPDTPPEPFPRQFVWLITNTAHLDYELGRFDESLRLYDRALPYTRNIQSPRDEAFCLHGIGLNYYALGDLSRAQAFLERALDNRKVEVDGRGRMMTLRALANVYAETGKLDQALAADGEALALAVAPYSIERIRVQRAVHTAAAGRLPEARAELDEVLSGGARADPVLHAEALLQRAILFRRMGRLRDALADLATVGPRLHKLGSVTREFAANLELARTLRQQGRPRAALEALERAVGESEALRLQTGNPELRLQLQAPLRSAYDLKIELLRARYEVAHATGREGEAARLASAAFAAADASRARTLADVAAQKYPAEVRRALAPEFRRRERLYRELAARRFTLEKRLDRSGPGDAQLRHLMSDIAELERQADTLNTLIATRTLPRGARVPTGLEDERLPRLPADTALVAYWLGSESAYAWVVSGAGIHWVRLPPPEAIVEEASAFHRSLTRLVDVPVERRLEAAGRLFAMIVGPVEPWLSGARQWVVIPDGALDYVPFAALRMPGKSDAFLVVRHDVAFTPAAWMLGAAGERAGPAEPRRLLLVADPVYQRDDPRLAAASAPLAQISARGPFEAPEREYRRLSYTAEEARQIAAEFSPADVERLIGLDATRERLLALDWSKYRFIHVAAHGIVDVQVPQLSALLLSSYDANGSAVDGAVRVADLSLKTLTAEVAVLSACDTALGREVPSEGIIGIGSTLLARGARAVVASLWPVSDEIGAHLMTDFYRHLLRDSMSAPAALGEAMRSVVARDASADPALWAAFQVSVVALAPDLAARKPRDSQNLASMTTPGRRP